LVHALQYVPGVDDRAVLEEARRWQDACAKELIAQVESHPNKRAPDRRIRVGYVCAHFRDHALQFFLEPLFQNHDQRKFEIHLYSDARPPDARTQHFRELADKWRDTAALTDAELDQLIREDRIDILIDLGMHSTPNRLLVFARKPAPIQLCWLAYPGTTGLS